MSINRILQPVVPVRPEAFKNKPYRELPSAYQHVLNNRLRLGEIADAPPSSAPSAVTQSSIKATQEQIKERARTGILTPDDIAWAKKQGFTQTARKLEGFYNRQEQRRRVSDTVKQGSPRRPGDFKHGNEWLMTLPQAYQNVLNQTSRQAEPVMNPIPVNPVQAKPIQNVAHATVSPPITMEQHDLLQGVLARAKAGKLTLVDAKRVRGLGSQFESIAEKLENAYRRQKPAQPSKPVQPLRISEGDVELVLSSSSFSKNHRRAIVEAWFQQQGSTSEAVERKREQLLKKALM